MNKVATYLNGHLMGHVLTAELAVATAERDGSVLARRPEMVARVASTSDIRKIMRFCSQLAEKGHVLPVTARGCGTDPFGAALGTGIVIDMQAGMHGVEGIDSNQQRIHVRAGTRCSAVDAVLATHKGLGLPRCSVLDEDGTVGGAVASAVHVGSLGGNRAFYEAAEQLEVVLSNGEVLQTGRLSRRDVAKKKGLATFEGELYRRVEELIDDNQELIEQLAARHSTAGYAGIARVKQRDGSMDLTPLFVGSQGSLGIISELIMKAEFMPSEVTVVTVACPRLEDAQAVMETAVHYRASQVQLLDGRLMERAAQQGKAVEWAPKDSYSGGVVIAVFANFPERVRARRGAKKLLKMAADLTGNVAQLHEVPVDEVTAFFSPLALAAVSERLQATCPPLYTGAWLPAEHLAAFLGTLHTLEQTYHCQLPISVDAVNGFIDILPVFDLKKVTERRTMLQLAGEVAQAVVTHHGDAAGRYSDGRMKAVTMKAVLPDDEVALYAAIKHAFDPLGILAPGVKIDVSAKEVAAELNAWCRAA